VGPIDDMVEATCTRDYINDKKTSPPLEEQFDPPTTNLAPS